MVCGRARVEGGDPVPMRSPIREQVDGAVLARGSGRRFEPLAREPGLTLSGPADRSGGPVVLWVEKGGPGFAVTDRPRVFARFSVEIPGFRR